MKTTRVSPPQLNRRQFLGAVAATFAASCATTNTAGGGYQIGCYTRPWGEHDWRVALDAQYTRSLTDYRGFAGVDPLNWQKIVDEGKYNPLRDTQVHGPPEAFYDEVLIYNGSRGNFITFSDYDTLDAALRVTSSRTCSA